MFNSAILVGILNFMVSGLLLLGADRLTHNPSHYLRILVASLLGGIYGYGCMQPGLAYLGNALMRLVSLLCMAWIAFGNGAGALHRGVVFLVLQLALTGLAAGNQGNLGIMLVAGAVAVLLCMAVLRQRFGGYLLPVELSYRDQKVSIKALRDTGNMLKDPLTGSPVLVVNADTARALTGLDAAQLRDPVQTLRSAQLPGLRLIPYRTVDRPGGMLLGLRVQQMRIGSWKGSGVVAFAPEGLDPEDRFQALTGGTV